MQMLGRALASYPQTARQILARFLSHVRGVDALVDACCCGPSEGHGSTAEGAWECVATSEAAWAQLISLRSSGDQVSDDETIRSLLVAMQVCETVVDDLALSMRLSLASGDVGAFDAALREVARWSGAVLAANACAVAAAALQHGGNGSRGRGSRGRSDSLSLLLSKLLALEYVDGTCAMQGLYASAREATSLDDARVCAVLSAFSSDASLALALRATPGELVFELLRKGCVHSLKCLQRRAGAEFHKKVGIRADKCNKIIKSSQGNPRVDVVRAALTSGSHHAVDFAIELVDPTADDAYECLDCRDALRCTDGTVALVRHVMASYMDYKGAHQGMYRKMHHGMYRKMYQGLRIVQQHAGRSSGKAVFRAWLESLVPTLQSTAATLIQRAWRDWAYRPPSGAMFQRATHDFNLWK